MSALRRLAWPGLGAAVGVVAIGLSLAMGSAAVAGDWYQAPTPWIGIGLWLIVVGLVAMAVLATLLDLLEPSGWWRVVAVLPALLLAAYWGSALVLTFLGDVPGGGVGDGSAATTDPATLFYDAPTGMALVIVATLALAAPAVIGRARRLRLQAPGPVSPAP